MQHAPANAFSTIIFPIKNYVIFNGILQNYQFNFSFFQICNWIVSMVAKSTYCSEYSLSIVKIHHERDWILITMQKMHRWSIFHTHVFECVRVWNEHSKSKHSGYRHFDSVWMCATNTHHKPKHNTHIVLYLSLARMYAWMFVASAMYTHLQTRACVIINMSVMHTCRLHPNRGMAFFSGDAWAF